MLKNNSTVRSILLVSLSNIGDVILSCPVLDVFAAEFPDAAIDLVVGPKAQGLFDGNPFVRNIFVFRKHQPVLQLLRWIKLLRQNSYDIVVDLRNTAIPFLLNAKHRSTPFMKKKADQHMRDKHLARCHAVFAFKKQDCSKKAIFIRNQDLDLVRDKLGIHGIIPKNYIVVAPGAADRGKIWPAERFANICAKLISDYDQRIVLIGDSKDKVTSQKVLSSVANPGVMDLSGETSLLQLAALINESSFALMNDSAPLHLASYFDIPVLGLFGATNPKHYGPWGKDGYLICNKTDDLRTPEECMQAIGVEEVWEKIKEMFLRHGIARGSHVK